MINDKVKALKGMSNLAYDLSRSFAEQGNGFQTKQWQKFAIDNALQAAELERAQKSNKLIDFKA